MPNRRQRKFFNLLWSDVFAVGCIVAVLGILCFQSWMKWAGP